MGSTQTTANHHKRYRVPSSTKSLDSTKYKRTDRLRTTMRSLTLRALAARNSRHSVSSSNNSTVNNSSFTSPHTIASVHSQSDTDPYLSDFDYRKLSTLTGLPESKINELHREFLILSRNGQLSYERYRTLLETIPIERTSTQLDRLARQTFSLFDKDGNNCLDFVEFIAAYIAMEKHEFSPDSQSFLQNSSLSQAYPSLTGVTRQAASRHTVTPKLLTNTSSTLPHQTTYLPTNYKLSHPHSSERYIYVTPSQYVVRQRERT